MGSAINQVVQLVVGLLQVLVLLNQHLSGKEDLKRIFDRLLPDLQARLQDSPRPEEALAAFDGFLSGLPAGVQLFSMFEANPALRALIVEIAASAPALARYLSRNAAVLDAVIGGDFFAIFKQSFRNKEFFS